MVKHKPSHHAGHSENGPTWFVRKQILLESLLQISSTHEGQFGNDCQHLNYNDPLSTGLTAMNLYAAQIRFHECSKKYSEG